MLSSINKIKVYMRLRTVKMLLMAVFMVYTGRISAQVYQNPLEWIALGEGNEAINKKISSQIRGQTETADRKSVV